MTASAVPSLWQRWDGAEAGALTRFAFTIVLGQLSQVGMAVLSTVMMAELGGTALAAGGLIGSVLLFLNLSHFGVLQGMMPMFSSAVSAQQHGLASSVLRAMFAITVLLGVPMTLLLLALPWLLQLVPLAPGVAAAAEPYTLSLLVGLLPGLLLTVARSTVYAVQRTASAVWIGLLGLLVNLLGNLVLINGWWGMPKLGLAGIGWSMSLSNIVMLVAQLAVLRMGSLTSTYFRAGGAGRWFDRALWRQLLGTGLPNGAVLFIETLLLSSSYWLMGWVSVTALAAHTVVMQWLQVLLILPLGLSQAAMVRLAVTIGKGDRDAALSVCNTSRQLTLVVALVSGAALLVWPQPAVELMLDAKALPIVEAAVGFVLLCALTQGLRAWVVVLAAMLRACREVSVLSAVAFGYWGVGFGCCWGLAIGLGWGGKGIWVGLAAGFAVAAVALHRRMQLTQEFIDEVIHKVLQDHAKHH
ncbi:MATE family efflux transporter [Paucibacter sp. XJ19-41]|nr:MATE family efflux transporter [Paucibacter sp. XJ19-41]MDC6167149.1 MATE family efflux transporter [Paucibacter sp. XJ19-41]